jgi:hypothetical protein
MDYKWAVNKVQVAENNLIVKVDLTVTGTDGKNSASAAYSRNLTRGDTFIPYEQLTEKQVLDWCFEPEVTLGQTYTIQNTQLPVLLKMKVKHKLQVKLNIKKIKKQQSLLYHGYKFQHNADKTVSARFTEES